MHDLCARHAQGEWIIPSVIREDCKGYFESFLQWFELVETVHLVEEELIDEVYGFCGHPDMIVTMTGQKKPRVVDLKTPVTRAKSWRLQIAGYNRLAEINGYHVKQSGTLRLSPKGRPPTYDEYADSAGDFNVFLSCLMSWKFFNEDKNAEKRNAVQSTKNNNHYGHGGRCERLGIPLRNLPPGR